MHAHFLCSQYKENEFESVCTVNTSQNSKAICDRRISLQGGLFSLLFTRQKASSCGKVKKCSITLLCFSDVIVSHCLHRICSPEYSANIYPAGILIKTLFCLITITLVKTEDDQS